MAGDRTTSQAAGSQSTKHCYPDTSTFLPPNVKEVHLFWSSLTAESSLLRGSPFRHYRSFRLQWASSI